MTYTITARGHHTVRGQRTIRADGVDLAAEAYARRWSRRLVAVRITGDYGWSGVFGAYLPVNGGLSLQFEYHVG